MRPFHAALSGRLAERGQTNQLLTRGCPRNRVPDTTTSVHHHTHSCLALQATLTTIKTRLSSTRTCSVETQRHNTHTRSQRAQDGRVGPIYHCRCTETPVFFLSWALLIALCIPKRRVIHLPICPSAHLPISPHVVVLTKLPGLLTQTLSTALPGYGALSGGERVGED